MKKLIIGLCVLSFVGGAVAAEKPAARTTASFRSSGPILNALELCAEVKALPNLTKRIKDYCKKQAGLARVERADKKKKNEFHAKVKQTIIANASKSSQPIPLEKLKWDTMSCLEDYEKTGFYCTVESTETTTWSSGDDGEGPDFEAKNGVRIHVDKKGNMLKEEYAISYECLECAA